MAIEAEVVDDRDVFDLSQLDLVRKLAGIGCNVSDICYLIGISRATFYRKLAANPALSEALEKGKAEAKSSLLTTLYKQATSGDFRALAFSLSVIHGVGSKLIDDHSNNLRSIEDIDDELAQIEERERCLTIGTRES